MAEKEERKDLLEKNLVWISELSKKDIPIAGGKGANLAEMFNAGMPVPNAFVVTAHAFLKFITESKLQKRILEIINTIRFENTKDLEDKAKQIRGMILATDFPKELGDEIKEAYAYFDETDHNGLVNNHYVAVRSSATTEDLATASFAGQQETFLNIKGPDKLLDAIRRCWASLYTARAIYYRNKNNFDQSTSLIAVVVQKMVESDKSGVMFSINPATSNKEEVVIEGVFGLGEGIVSGTIEPDTYILDKKSGELKEKRIGKKKVIFVKGIGGETVIKDLDAKKQDEQVFGLNEINELFRLAIKIDGHYKWPQDIEFAIENNKIYIVQSRPVTTIKEEKEKIVNFKGGEEKIILSGLAASHGFASGVVKVIYSLGELDKIKEGDILVTKMTNPDMVVTMQKSKAIVTDEGGMTAHAAIVSREIGIPCIVGTRTATKTLKDGMIVTVDGTKGVVYEGEVEIEEEPIGEQIKEHEQELNKIIETKIEAPYGEVEESAEIPEYHSPSEIESYEKIMVKVNCDLPYVARKAAATGADGVGLVRIEFIIAQSGVHPAEYIRENRMSDYTIVLVNGLKDIAEAFKGKPVWVRTSDIRTDEYRTLKGADKEPRESNPMLGWHGIRRGLEQSEILKSELRAVKQLHDMGYTNVGVMFPFLVNVKEIIKAKQFMKECGLIPEKTDFGVMIETPASCWIIEELCNQGIKFISFGTNDLTQLTIGIDRNNERLAYLHNEMHPAMQEQIKHVINVCRKHGVKTSICGQAGSNPDMVKFLVSNGISSISANLDAVDIVRNIVDGMER